MTGEKYLTLENVCAGALVIWGAFVANPLVCTFSKNPLIYAPMANLTTNEVFWGGAYILAGIGVIALSLTGRRRGAALIVAVTYISLATLFFMGDVESQAWGFFGFLGICNFIKWRGYKWKSEKASNGSSVL